MNKLILFVVISISSVFIEAATIDNTTAIDCVSINTNFQEIERLKKSKDYINTLPVDKVETFDYQSNVSFKEYLSYARHHIITLNPKAQMPCPIETNTSKILFGKKALSERQIVDFIQPFELNVPESKTAVLLIHGLTDSPYLFHDLAAEFYHRNISVRTILLPAHGTAASALIDVDEEQWLEAAHYGIERILSDFEHVYLGGFSTGGALIIDQFLSDNFSEAELNKVKGLMLWSPASKAKSSAAWAAKYLDYVPFLDYLNKSADIDFAKYESFPINAGAQVHALMNKIGSNNSRYQQTPDIPMFVVASSVDTTIDTQETLKILSKWHVSNERKTKHQDHLMYFGQEADLVFLPETLKRTVSSCEISNVCERIVDIAHTSVTNSPTNPHYGLQGSYRNCEHLLNKDEYKKCKQTQRNMFGEVTKTNVDKYPQMQRLTFNPNFDEMISLLEQFLDSTGYKVYK